MAASKKFYNLENEKDIEEIHRLLFDESDDKNVSKGQSESASTCETRTQKDDVGEEYDTDEYETIEERQESSESEQSHAESSSDEEDEADFYIATRKKNEKVVERFSWKKTPFSAAKRTSKQNLIRKLPGVIGHAKNATSILESWSCFFSENMLNAIVKFTNQGEL
ncbi:uncharacterized protein [Leptinotarsa decemlineata]|uniref:uncharacterized protein n=1 Tax=Leptinotarsa decemlineata TaxID=7539 RepID=UPI003D307084